MACPAVLAIGTALPPFRVNQTAAAHWMRLAVAGRPDLASWVPRLYHRSGIETRYSCVPDFQGTPEESRLAPFPTEPPLGTGERMALYRRESVPLAVAAGRRALADAAHCGHEEGRRPDRAVAADRVTHLLVVTCTGFFSPGLDQHLSRELGLPEHVQRTVVGFMGCGAAFNALRMAADIVRGNSAARVLVVCVELSTIHLQPYPTREDLVAASLFGDGAAACVVADGNGVDARTTDCFPLVGHHSGLRAGTDNDMVWTIGDHGFRLHLSPRIPDHLAAAVPEAVGAMMGTRGRAAFWAVHPGGRAIIERLEQILGLSDRDTTASRRVLRRIGNVSSPTILFVLQEIREELRQRAKPVEGVAMAFGPGLTIEMAHLAYTPAREATLGRTLSRGAASA